MFTHPDLGGTVIGLLAIALVGVGRADMPTQELSPQPGRASPARGSVPVANGNGPGVARSLVRCWLCWRSRYWRAAPLTAP